VVDAQQGLTDYNIVFTIPAESARGAGIEHAVHAAMRERYRPTDYVLLPHVPEDPRCAEALERTVAHLNRTSSTKPLCEHATGLVSYRVSGLRGGAPETKMAYVRVVQLVGQVTLAKSA
jgi:hypothetical protein